MDSLPLWLSSHTRGATVMLEAQGAAMATPLAEVVEVATPVLGEEELTLGGAVVVTLRDLEARCHYSR